MATHKLTINLYDFQDNPSDDTEVTLQLGTATTAPAGKKFITPHPIRRHPNNGVVEFDIEDSASLAGVPQYTAEWDGAPHSGYTFYMPAQDSNLYDLINIPQSPPVVTIPQGGGLDQQQVDARVAAGVEDWAEEGNTDPIPAGKLSNAPSGGIDQAAVDARIRAGVKDFAEAGSSTLIGTSDIANVAITNQKIAGATLDNRVMANDAIDTDNIQDDAVTRDKIADDAIDASKIAAGAVGGSEIADSSVEGRKLANDTVTETKMANNSVGTDQIVNNSVNSDKIAANAVGSSELAANSVGSSEIQTNAVTATEIANNTIVTGNIADNAVTASKLDDTAESRLIPSGGNNDQILAKASNSNYDTEWIDAPTGGGGGLTQSQVDARIQQFARAGNTDLVPQAKLASGGSVGQVLKRTATGQEWANDEGLTQSQVDARVQSGVQDWAETGNNDEIPVGKLAAGGLTGQSLVRTATGKRWQTVSSGAGTPLSVTAVESDFSPALASTDFSGLTEHQINITAGTLDSNHPFTVSSNGIVVASNTNPFLAELGVRFDIDPTAWTNSANAGGNRMFLQAYWKKDGTIIESTRRDYYIRGDERYAPTTHILPYNTTEILSPGTYTLWLIKVGLAAAGNEINSISLASTSSINIRSEEYSGGNVESGLNEAAVDARVSAGVLDWAETGDTDTIPSTKLASGGSVGQVLKRTATGQEWGADAGGLSQSQVDARVQAGVKDYAETGGRQIQSGDIGTGQVTSTNIADATIVSGDIASDSITGANIAPNAIGSSELANNAVQTANIGDDQVTPDKLQADSATQKSNMRTRINAAEAGHAHTLGAGSVDTNELADEAVETAKIDDDAVTRAKIGAGAVGTTELGNNAVTTAKVANTAINADKIANLAVTEAKLASNSVSERTIQDDAVRSAQIQANAVGSSEIADDAVGADQLASDAVVTASIVDDAVTEDKIANAVVNRFLPAGGADEQILAKSAAGDYQVEWIDAPSGGSGDVASPFMVTPLLSTVTPSLADTGSTFTTEGNTLQLNLAAGTLNSNHPFSVSSNQLVVAAGTNPFLATIETELEIDPTAWTSVQGSTSGGNRLFFDSYMSKDGTELTGSRQSHYIRGDEDWAPDTHTIKSSFTYAFTPGNYTWHIERTKTAGGGNEINAIQIANSHIEINSLRFTGGTLQASGRTDVLAYRSFEDAPWGSATAIVARSENFFRANSDIYRNSDLIQLPADYSNNTWLVVLAKRGRALPAVSLDGTVVSSPPTSSAGGITLTWANAGTVSTNPTRTITATRSRTVERVYIIYRYREGTGSWSDWRRVEPQYNPFFRTETINFNPIRNLPDGTYTIEVGILSEGNILTGVTNLTWTFTLEDRTFTWGINTIFIPTRAITIPSTGFYPIDFVDAFVSTVGSNGRHLFVVNSSRQFASVGTSVPSATTDTNRILEAWLE